MTGRATIGVHTVCFIALSSLVTGHVYAAEIDYGLSAGVERSDNIYLSTTGEQDEWIRTYRGQFLLVENSTNWNSLVNLDVSYHDYKEDLFEDENEYQGNVQVTWRPLPDRLMFHLEDYYAQAIIDSAALETPDNREDINYFSVGPEFHVPLGGTNAIVLETRYINNYYEITDADSHGTSSTAGILHRSSSETEWSINYQVDTTNYDNEVLYRNFREQTLFLGVERRNPINSYRLTAGTSRIEQDGREPFDGNTGSIRWHRVLSSDTYMDFRLDREYATEEETLAIDGEGGSTGGATVDTEAGEIFLFRRAALSFGRDNVFGRQYISLQGSRISYIDDDTNDQEAALVELEWSYNFGSDVRVGLQGSYEVAEYPNRLSVLTGEPEEDKDTLAELFFNYRMRRNFAIRFAYSVNQRKSVDEDTDYRENRVGLVLAYETRPFDQRVITRQR